MQKTFFTVFICLLLCACQTSNTSDARRKPNLKAAHYNVELGMVYLQQNQRQRAKEKLLIAIQQAPRWPVAIDAMAYYLEITGETKEAEGYYRRAVAIDSRSGSALNNYGTFFCRNNQYEQAERYFLAAVAQKNYLNSAEAYENAGLCALKFSHQQKAEDYFKKALLEDVNRPKSLFSLAEIYYSQGKYADAKNCLAKYLKLQSHDAQSLLLEIKIASKLQDRDTVQRDSKLLSDFYPSAETSHPGAKVNME